MDLKGKQEYITIPKQEYDEMRQNIIFMQHELDNLKRMLFGKKSERFAPQDPAQLNLGFDIVPEKPEPTLAQPPSKKRRKEQSKPANKREPIPEHLPREEVVLSPEVDVSRLVRLEPIITEYYEYIPGKLLVKKIIRKRYMDPETKEFFIAPLPDLPLPGSNAGPSMLSHIIVSKFVDHLPFYRQSKMMERDLGVHLAESTLNGWLKGTCQLLEPLYNVLRKSIQKSHYIQADETPIPVLTQDKPGSTHKGYQWVYHGVKEKLVCFDYHKSRGREGPDDFLKIFHGALQTDAYSVYDMFDAKAHIKMLGCWAHTRRYFDKARDNDKQRSDYALSKIQALYMIDREFASSNSPDRLQKRIDDAEPIIKGLKIWMENQLPDVLPKSPIGKAIGYALGIWERLTDYIYDESWLMDNNLAENQIRPVALGRKNFMFAGSHNGAERAAMMYSFLGSCKLNGVNPQDWLTHVLTVIPGHKANKLEDLLPHKFANQ